MITMRWPQILALVTIALVAVLLVAENRAFGTPDVCPPLDSGKIDTTGDPASVTVTAPAGKLITGYCAKAGSEQSGAGTEIVLVDQMDDVVL